MNGFSRTPCWKLHLSIGVIALTLTVSGPGTAQDRHSGAPTCGDPAHFVLVHGAWHGAWAWYKTKTQLEKLGHTVTTVELPSHGIDHTSPETVTLDDYVDRVAEAVDEAGEPVVLVGHSLAGIVISMAAEARPGAVEKLVYLAALLLEDGQSVLDIIALAPDAPLVANMIPGDGVMDVNREAAADLFYNLSPPTDITLAASLMVPNPLLPMVTPISVTEENFGSVPRYYITTTEDNTIPSDMQTYMYTVTPCEAVFTIHSDHSPFFSRPRELSSILERISNR